MVMLVFKLPLLRTGYVHYCPLGGKALESNDDDDDDDDDDIDIDELHCPILYLVYKSLINSKRFSLFLKRISGSCKYNSDKN